MSDDMASTPITKTCGTQYDSHDPKTPSAAIHNEPRLTTTTTTSTSEISQDHVSFCNQQDILCEPCAQINFQSMVFRGCGCQEILATASTVGTTQANKTCPSCRLISHHISALSRADEISAESQISLWVTHTHSTGGPTVGANIQR